MSLKMMLDTARMSQLLVSGRPVLFAFLHQRLNKHGPALKVKSNDLSATVLLFVRSYGQVEKYKVLTAAQ